MNKLESHYHDMQDMEFTIEEGKLFMLQTRNGKRTAAAAFKIACDLVDEGQITQEQAVRMIDPKQIDALLHPQFNAGRPEGRHSDRQGPAGLSRVPPPARWSFTAEDAAAMRQGRASRSSWFAWRPLPRTSRACTTPRAS